MNKFGWMSLWQLSAMSNLGKPRGNWKSICQVPQSYIDGPESSHPTVCCPRPVHPIVNWHSARKYCFSESLQHALLQGKICRVSHAAHARERPNLIHYICSLPPAHCVLLFTPLGAPDRCWSSWSVRRPLPRQILRTTDERSSTHSHPLHIHQGLQRLPWCVLLPALWSKTSNAVDHSLWSSHGQMGDQSWSCLHKSREGHLQSRLSGHDTAEQLDMVSSVQHLKACKHVAPSCWPSW